MTPLRLLLALSALLVGAAVLLWLLYAGEQYVFCLIDHRSGVQITTDRQTIHRECLLRLSPFFL